ncbi:MAG: peptidylprolyl isomerase [Candidatus Edwardsbacteria bacterium]
MLSKTTKKTGLILLIGLITSCKSSQIKQKPSPRLEEKPKTEAKVMEFNQPMVTIETTYGKIVLELFPKEAPKTVANFAKLITEGFYNGCSFHRVVPNFVIQGGDPNSKDNDPNNDGYGGGQMEVEPRKLSNIRGTVSMASASRQQPIDSQSDAQFFINLKDNTRLDAFGFIPFGKVIQGMEVVEKIEKAKRDERDRPLENVVMNKVTVEEGVR